MPRTRTGWVTVIITVCSFALCGPLLTHGPLPLGSDVYATHHYLQGFMKSIGEGNLYPRWTDRTNQDLGAPSFVLAPPLTFYGAAAASWLTGSTISGFKLYLVVVALLSGVSFYALARQWIGPGLTAALAGGLYLLLPYHVLDMYQRFAMSETTSFIFFPLILLFARRSLLVGRFGDFACLSLSYAGLIFTHIVSAWSFSLFLGLWLLWEARGRWLALLRPVLALTCGLTLAAPALLPAVMEKDHANISWVREMPNGDFRINFIFKDEVLPGLGIKDAVKRPVLKSAHSQLLLAAVAAGLALAWSSSDQRRRRRDVLTLAGGCALAYLLQLEISTPVWLYVPELATIQFPWRLQTIMVLTTSLLAGYALSTGWGRAGGSQAASRGLVGPGSFLIGVAVLANLYLAVQNAHLKPFRYDETINMSPMVIHWTEPSFTPIQFQPYREFKRIQISMPRAAFVEGSGDVKVVNWASSERSLEVDSPVGGEVALRSFWFPGWSGTLDGQPLLLRPSSPYGTILFQVPAGRHAVRMRFEATPVRRAAPFIGLTGILATALLGWWSERTSRSWAMHASLIPGPRG